MSRIRFGVIGLNHGHVYSMVETLQKGGAELVSFFSQEDDLGAAFTRRHPHARRVRSHAAVLEDSSLHMVACAAIPSDRAAIGIEAMRCGKDVLCDKAAFLKLDELTDARRVQQETGRIFAVYYSERLCNLATLRAAELVRDGAIGRVLHTTGMGPHRLSAPTRPAWFWQRDKTGGILIDIGSHQIEQFLFFSGSRSVEIGSAQVANYAHPEYSDWEDWGDVLLRGDNGTTGYFRVDWLTPHGLPTLGDVRLFIQGSAGFIEVRKNCDIAGREGGDHLYVVNNDGTHYIPCDTVENSFGHRLVDDVLHRTQTALDQEHCFLAAELAIHAQKEARCLRGVTDTDAHNASTQGAVD
jgi:predicted dehydrogenase